MKRFRKSQLAGHSYGDAIPFYHEGKYHVFSLTPPEGTTVYPDRLRTSWHHRISTNLIDWEETEVALVPGENCSADKDGCWTGSVIFAEGEYHCFYTGFCIGAKHQQTICRAVSDDCIHWKKDPRNPYLLPETDKYEAMDWRDSYIFYNEDDKLYWLLISARKNEGPKMRRGVVVLYRSSDLENWSHYGPLYHTNTNCPECPEMYKMNGYWYLAYSRFSENAGTIYRVSKSPFGPFRVPSQDGIGGRRFYAAKSIQNDNGRRFYFAWAHDRANKSDDGEWYWGGIYCIPHEVCSKPDGNLDVKMPQEIADALNQNLPWDLCPQEGIMERKTEDTFTAEAIGTMAYGFLDTGDLKSMLLQCKIKPMDCNDSFGLLLKCNDHADRGYHLSFDVAAQRVTLMKMPWPLDPFWAETCPVLETPVAEPDGPRVCEKPFRFQNGDSIDVKIVIDHNMMEMFIGNQVAFTFRSYSPCSHELGWFVRDGKTEFSNIKVSK